MSEKDMEYGRLTAKKPKIRKKAQELAKALNKKPSEVVEEALDFYSKYILLQDVDSKSLMAGMMLYKSLLNDAVSTLSSVAQLFSTDMFKLMFNLYTSIPSNTNSDELKSKALDALSTFMPTIINSLLNILTSLSNTNLGSSVAQSNTQQGLNVKIS